MRCSLKLFFLPLLIFVSATGISFSESTSPATERQNPDRRIITTQPQRSFSTPRDVRVYSTAPRAADSYSDYSVYPGHLSVGLRYIEIDRKGKFTRKDYSKKHDHRSGDNWRSRRDLYEWRGRHDRYNDKYNE